LTHSKYLDALSVEQRDQLKRTLYAQQNHACFIYKSEMDLNLQRLDIDHVKPLTLGGSDDSTNFVLTHFDCNRQKQDSSLYVVRCMKRYDKIRDAVYKKLEGLQISRICFQVLEVQSMICRFKFRATEFATPWKRLKGSPLKQLRNRFALTQFS